MFSSFGQTNFQRVFLTVKPFRSHVLFSSRFTNSSLIASIERRTSDGVARIAPQPLGSSGVVIGVGIGFFGTAFANQCLSGTFLLPLLRISVIVSKDSFSVDLLEVAWYLAAFSVSLSLEVPTVLLWEYCVKLIENAYSCELESLSPLLLEVSLSSSRNDEFKCSKHTIDYFVWTQKFYRVYTVVIAL